MIELEFLTEVPEEIELAKRYWDLAADGKFVCKVTALLPFRSVRTAGQLAAMVRTFVIARDSRQSCPTCGKHDILAARSNFKPHVSSMPHVCQACRAAEELAKRAARESAAQAMQKEVDELAKRKRAIRVDFKALPDDIAMLLLALDKAVSPRLVDGSFNEHDCRYLAPWMVHDFIDRLQKSNAIIFRPDLCPPGTFESKDDDLIYYTDMAVYQLTPAANNESPASVMTGLRRRAFGGSAALAELWLDHATADCVRYALDFCKRHHLPVSRELASAIASVVRVAAATYSVAAIWNAIWKVVLDAAALSRTEFYNLPKAAETLPGKMKRLLEKVKRGDATLKPWDRPPLQPSGTLGELFYEMFGIDEGTPGAEALSILAPPAASPTSGPDHRAQRVHTDELFYAAAGHNVTLEVVETFAEAIAKGHSVPDAIGYVYEAHPYLGDPF